MSVPATHAASVHSAQNTSQNIATLLVSCLLCLALLGCATLRTPTAIDDTTVRERAVTATVRNVQVSAAVLSAEDNQNFFGTYINDTDVQTVWVEISNNSQHTLWLLRSGTDPDYFSPLEVAWSYHGLLSGDANSKIDDHFDSLSIESLIPPGETRSGILYANPHHGTRVLNIDLLGQQALIPFTLFLPVPGEQAKGKWDEIAEHFAESRNNDYQDETEFRKALEQLPCCTTDAHSSIAGGPVNLILIGELPDIVAALIYRGYRHLQQDPDKTQRLFGRIPDLVARKAGQGGVPSNWIRLWVAPLRYKGQPVMLAQTGRPVGGRFQTDENKTLLLHPDVDETRSLIVQDLMYSGGLAQLGFVGGVMPVTVEQQYNHPDEFIYHTDGYRAVLFFVTRPLGLSNMEILDWVPLLEHQITEAAENNAKEQTDVQQAH